MSYKEALAYIAGLSPRGWRLGLDRMSEFARRVGLEDSLGQPGGPQFIHVAGTNGKGSVTAFVQSILTAAGYRTGGFFSPYVYDPRERVQYRCELIPEEDFAAITERLIPIADSLADTELGEVTEFEFKTALGLEYWKQMECQWVALEVGLGGRLDSTNIVTPRCSVITSISLDHTAILGSSLAAIAREKAGIIKPGVPVVVGDLPEEAMCVVEQKADEQGSSLWRLGKAFATADTKPWGLEAPLPGRRMAQNIFLSMAAIPAAGIKISFHDIQKGVASTLLPGRFERRTFGGIEAVFDGAHNSSAAASLAETLRAEYPGRRKVLLTGMVAGHDPISFYQPLAELIDSAHITPIDFHRAVPPDDLAAIVSRLIPRTSTHSCTRDALNHALRDCGGDALLLVTGSFYLLAEVAAEGSRTGRTEPTSYSERQSRRP
ncbi:MAG: folylpolyglutamate synthase/dihydrofolate synthase family protein [Fimbriimonadaceae bacterium]